MKNFEIAVIENARCYIFRREAEPVKKVTKAAVQRERKAKVGRGLSKYRNSVRRPSEVIVTTF
jgi:hypothetical protein